MALSIRQETLGERAPETATCLSNLASNLDKQGRYLEAEDLDAARRAIAATEANTRWQRDMRRFFVSVDGQAPAGDLVLLEPIFNLDDQLVAQSEKAGSETNGS